MSILWNKYNNVSYINITLNLPLKIAICDKKKFKKMFFIVVQNWFVLLFSFKCVNKKPRTLNKEIPGLTTTTRLSLQNWFQRF